MSGMKMMKRTRGIEQFEFLGLEDAILEIRKNKEQRKLQRISDKEGINRMREVEIQKDLHDHLSNSHTFSEYGHENTSNRESSTSTPIPNEFVHEEGEVLWEAARSEASNEILSPDKVSKVAEIEQEEEFTIRLSSSEETTSHQTNVLITVAGWVQFDQDDHTFPFSILEPGQNGDQYTLIWETKVLADLWSMLSILVGEVASFIFQQGLQATLLPALMGALTGPMWLIKLTYLVDNPWGILN
jgi:hypothetical protein